MVHGSQAVVSLWLPVGAAARQHPDSRVRPLVRQLVVDALAATGEWPISVRIVSSQGVSSGPMKRWFVEYETDPHGEIADPRDLFD
jgi:hypothetical protein